MKEIKVKVYFIDELNDEAKEKALNWLRENNNYEFLESDLEMSLKELLGVSKIEFNENLAIYYSLSYSQGDGFCFEGDFEYKGYEVNIKKTGHYSHKNSVEIDITNDEGEDVSTEIYTEFKEVYDDLCDKLEKMGYESIEYEDREENIIELANANEFTFLESGRVFTEY